jgi:uncharacterized membrane protein YtjA (UPF0391 family)
LDVFGQRSSDGRKSTIMFIWTLTFFILALIAAVLGLTGLGGTARQLAWLVFAVLLFGSAMSVLTGRYGSAV